VAWFHPSFPLTTTIPLVGLVSYFLSGHRRHSPRLSLTPSSLLVSVPKATTLRTGLDLVLPTRGVCRLATLGPQNPRLLWLTPCRQPLGLLLGTTVNTPHPFVIGRCPGGLGSPCWPQPVLQKVQPTRILGIWPSTTPGLCLPPPQTRHPWLWDPPFPSPPPSETLSIYQASHGTPHPL